MKKDEVGIKDVARLAGVSVGTVSNVLNRPDLVSDVRREHVERAIAQLGYVPNGAARTLKARTSRSMGLIVGDAQNPFYGQLVAAAEAEAEREDLGVLVANSRRRPNREIFHLRQFAEQRVRGALLAPSSNNIAEIRRIHDSGFPVVLVDAARDTEGFCSVSVDDRLGGYLAVKHLLDEGRRDILVVGGPSRFRQVVERHSGAMRALVEHPTAKMRYLEAEEMTILAGRAVGQEIIQEPSGTWPDAIFAMNDLLATGILQALYMEGRASVPERIALIGYDDIDFCESAVVPISSIRQPSAQLGSVGVQLLHEEAAQGTGHQHRSVLLHPSLVARASTLGRSKS